MKASTRRKPETLESVADAMRALGRQAREAARALALGADRGEERGADGGGARDAGRRRRRSSPPTSATWPRRRRRAAAAAFLDRLALDPKRIEAMAKGLEEIAALPDPVGTVLAEVDAAERPEDRARARAAGRHRHHLREPAERDGRRRRAVPQGRQRGDPARRLGQPPLQPRDPGVPRPRPARGGPARCGDPARADHRPRGGRPDAEGPRRRHRRDRAARRQEPGGARAGGSARAGVRAPGRHLPHLRRPQRRPRHGQGASSSTPRCGAPACAAPPRRCWSIARRPPAICQALVAALLEAGCEVRGDAAGAEVPTPGSSAATEQDWSTEYLDAIIAVKIGRRRRRRHRAHRALRLAAHRLHRRAGQGHGRALPRRPRQRDRAAQRLDPVRRRRRVRHGRRDRHRHRPAARPRARSASSSSPPSSTWCAAPARCGRVKRAGRRARRRCGFRSPGPRTIIVVGEADPATSHLVRSNRVSVCSLSSAFAALRLCSSTGDTPLRRSSCSASSLSVYARPALRGA